VSPLRIRVRWLAWLIYLHRWLGIAGCLLFLAWFASGIVMMYARMPVVTPEEHLFHAETLDPSGIRVTPAEAAAKAGAKSVDGLQVAMLDGRPVYRFPPPSLATVFADTGELLARPSEAAAMTTARRWAPGQAATMRYDALITIADQWTIQTRQHLPMHRIALGDAADSYIYVSSRTGDIVMDTSRSERFWGYLGPVMHWLYLPILRRNGPLWTQVIIWTSSIGCVMCVAGLVLGLVRFSPSARFRLRGTHTPSPYSGLMMWHHYAGLVFGVITFTWTFSGLLSMGPFDWLSNGGLTAAQRQAVTGGPRTVDGVTVARLQGAVAAISPEFAPKELSLVFFRGEPYWMADAAPERLSEGERVRAPKSERVHRLVSALRPESGTFARFDDATMETVARAVMPGVAVTEATWLRQYDSYYYDRRGARPLPVLRVRYGDPEATWLYFDPQRGDIALVSRPNGRLERWLYQGLHSLDFPVLFYRRPLWDLVVMVLSLGGIALGVTILKPAWIRVRRHAARLRPKSVTMLYRRRTERGLRHSGRRM
jgi:hypothetical protein